jgi:hypothetical protein
VADNWDGGALKAVRFAILTLSALAGIADLRAQGAAVPGIHATAFVENVFSTGTLAKFSLGLLYDQATVQAPRWGSGAAGFRKRAEWRMAGLFSRAAAEYGVARLRGTETGYERCRCKGFLPRSRHAIVSEFVERRAEGGLAAPIARASGIAAAVGVTSLAQRSGVGDAGKHATVLVGADAGFNVLQEFWPEIKRTLLLRRK